MLDLNYLAIAVAAVVAVVLSSVYYMGFAKQMAALHPAYADPSTPPWKVLVELVRTLVLSVLVGGLASKLGITELSDALLLGLSLWVVPIVLFTGAIVWERVPRKLAGIHIGDWLLKLVLISVIVGLWT